nr:prepilin-type N-terminal cleavage/methylation domain-containing protein [Frondihabitans sucicola]
MSTSRALRRRPSDSGFSFIELLAYMAIAALLTLAAIPQFNQYRQKAAVSNVQNDLHNAALAMEGVYVTDQAYPQTLPSFKTSKDVTISDPSSDPYGLGAVMNLLQVNTGQPVNITDMNGQSSTGASTTSAPRVPTCSTPHSRPSGTAASRPSCARPFRRMFSSTRPPPSRRRTPTRSTKAHTSASRSPARPPGSSTTRSGRLASPGRWPRQRATRPTPSA